MRKTCLYWYIKFKKFITPKSYSKIIDEKEKLEKEAAEKKKDDLKKKLLLNCKWF